MKSRAPAPRSVSVIVPTYNRSLYVRRVISSYFQPAVTQVVIVDDGSSEDYGETIDYANREAAARGIELVCCRHAQRLGAPVARNTALAKVNGDAVLFTDDDVLIAPDFVEQGLRKLADGRVDIATARMILASEFESIDTGCRIGPGSTGSLFNYLTLTGDYRVDPGSDIEVPFGHTVSLWNRWIIDAGVRFDGQYLGNGYREESAAQVRARQVGANVMFCPRMVFWHVRSLRVGGQHRGSKLWWYAWSVRNNLRFLREYYSYLCKAFHLPLPSWMSALCFALRLTSTFVPAEYKDAAKQFIYRRHSSGADEWPGMGRS